MSWSRAVFSSNVAEVGWDDDTKEIIVVFNSGQTGAYSGADEETADKLSKAPSVGRMLNSEIKPRYSYRRIA